MLCFVGVRIVDKIAFIFPGQASQFVGMANDFHSTHTEAQELFSRANDLLGFDLEKDMSDFDIKRCAKGCFYGYK